MNDKILLTIGIPTYNRSKCLNECLTSIFNQESINFNQIEILISDNNSTDETPLIVRKWKEKFLLLKYTKNSKNLGPTLNFRKVLDKSRGNYIWLFSDDDILSDNCALAKILPFCVNGKYKFIWVGAKTMGSPVGKKKNKIIEVNHIQLLSTLDSGLISRCIFQRKAYSQCKKSFLESPSDHVGLILEVALKNKSLIITAPLVSQGLGSEYPTPRPRCLDLFKVVEDFKGDYPDYAIKKFKKRMFFKSLIYITAGAKIRGEKKYREKFIKYYKDIPIVMVIFNLIWYLPTRLLLFFRKLYRLIK